MTLEIPVEKTTALVPRGPGDVLALMTAAVDKGLPVETMESLQRMYHAEQDRAAAREFADAMARFQKECPPIPKTASSKSTSEGSGKKFAFTYAPLDQIAETINPHLHKHGLSYSWDTEQTERGISCVCTLRHQNGHSIKATFACPTDSNLPIGSQQKFGAALTYARRYSLIQVLGITTADPDEERGETGETITDEQAATLEALTVEVKADAKRFLKWLGVEAFSHILASDYGKAVAALEAKRVGR